MERKVLFLDQPNIVLIMADQFRGDCLGIAGHPDIQTPHLDTLAAQGIRFENAYSACPSCIAARAALMTGRAQQHHGRVGYRDMVPWNYADTLASTLSEAGYYTQCVGKMHVHPLRNLLGFHHVDLHDGTLTGYRDPNLPYADHQLEADDYFHWYRQLRGAEADVGDTGLDCNAWVARPWMDDEKTHPTNWVTSRSIDFLRRRDPRKPFFLMASYVRPHPPLDAPAHYFDLYMQRTLTPPPVGDWADSARLAAHGRIHDSMTGPSDPALLRMMQVGYYACITHLDHQIGRLLHAIAAHKLLDNTVFLFASDHGEELGDHLQFRKTMPTQGSCHIPLLLSGRPLDLSQPSNRVCSAVVELRDLMPTCLNLAGHPAPARVDGQSLLPLALGQKRSIRPWLHGEHSAGALSNHWIVTETEKYAWFSQTGRELYFRLDVDPQERHNLAGDDAYTERIGSLRAALIQALTGREEGYTDGKRLIPGQAPQATLANAHLP